MAMLCPSTNPASFKPCRNAVTRFAASAADVTRRKPTTGWMAAGRVHQAATLPPRPQPQRTRVVSSFDHLVGAREQRCWHFESERLGSLEVDRKLVLHRRLRRQVGRLLALEDAIDVASRAAILVEVIGSITR